MQPFIFIVVAVVLSALCRGEPFNVTATCPVVNQDDGGIAGVVYNPSEACQQSVPMLRACKGAMDACLASFNSTAACSTVLQTCLGAYVQCTDKSVVSGHRCSTWGPGVYLPYLQLVAGGAYQESTLRPACERLVCRIKETAAQCSGATTIVGVYEDVCRSTLSTGTASPSATATASATATTSASVSVVATQTATNMTSNEPQHNTSETAAVSASQSANMSTTTPIVLTRTVSMTVSDEVLDPVLEVVPTAVTEKQMMQKPLDLKLYLDHNSLTLQGPQWKDKLYVCLRITPSNDTAEPILDQIATVYRSTDDILEADATSVLVRIPALPKLLLTKDITFDVSISSSCLNGPIPSHATSVDTTFTVEHVREEILPGVPMGAIRSAEAVGFAAGGIGGVATFSTGAAALPARVFAITETMTCIYYYGEPIPWYKHPTGIALGPTTERTRYYFGGAVMNPVLMFSCLLVHLGVAHLISESKRISFRDAVALVRFPSISLVPMFVFLQPSIECCFVVVLHGVDTGLRVGAGFLLAMWLLIIGKVFMVLTRGFKSQYTPKQYGHDELNRDNIARLAVLGSEFGDADDDSLYKASKKKSMSPKEKRMSRLAKARMLQKQREEAQWRKVEEFMDGDGEWIDDTLKMLEPGLHDDSATNSHISDEEDEHEEETKEKTTNQLLDAIHKKKVKDDIAKQRFTFMYGSLFDNCREYRHRFMLVELALIVAMAVIASIHPSDCDLTTLLMLIALAAYTIMVVVLRPRKALFEKLTHTVMAILQLVAIALIYAALHNEDKRDSYYESAGWISMTVLFFSGAVTLVLLGWVCFTAYQSYLKYEKETATMKKQILAEKAKKQKKGPGVHAPSEDGRSDTDHEELQRTTPRLSTNMTADTAAIEMNTLNNTVSMEDEQMTTIATMSPGHRVAPSPLLTAPTLQSSHPSLAMLQSQTPSQPAQSPFVQTPQPQPPAQTVTQRQPTPSPAPPEEPKQTAEEITAEREAAVAAALEEERRKAAEETKAALEELRATTERESREAALQEIASATKEQLDAAAERTEALRLELESMKEQAKLNEDTRAYKKKLRAYKRQAASELEDSDSEPSDPDEADREWRDKMKKQESKSHRQYMAKKYGDAHLKDEDSSPSIRRSASRSVRVRTPSPESYMPHPLQDAVLQRSMYQANPIVTNKRSHLQNASLSRKPSPPQFPPPLIAPGIDPSVSNTSFNPHGQVAIPMNRHGHPTVAPPAAYNSYIQPQAQLSPQGSEYYMPPEVQEAHQQFPGIPWVQSMRQPPAAPHASNSAALRRQLVEDEYDVL